MLNYNNNIKEIATLYLLNDNFVLSAVKASKFNACCRSLIVNNSGSIINIRKNYHLPNVIIYVFFIETKLKITQHNSMQRNTAILYTYTISKSNTKYFIPTIN